MDDNPPAEGDMGRLGFFDQAAVLRQDESLRNATNLKFGPRKGAKKRPKKGDGHVYY